MRFHTGLDLWPLIRIVRRKGDSAVVLKFVFSVVFVALREGKQNVAFHSSMESGKWQFVWSPLGCKRETMDR